jgi:adsorption protein B
MLMRFAFTAHAYGVAEGLRAIPRSLVGNLVAVLAARRALDFHARRDRRWEKTDHIFVREAA